MKNFNSEKFIEDLTYQHLEHIFYFADNPNDMWNLWKTLFNEVLNKHAPIQHKKIKSKNVPWVTRYIKQLIIDRNAFKRKAIINKNETDCNMFKQLRDKVNNIEVRKAKQNYYARTIAGLKNKPKETWKTIDHLLGSQNRRGNVNELSIDGINLTNFEDIAEGFNLYFSKIGSELTEKLDSLNCNF